MRIVERDGRRLLEIHATRREINQHIAYKGAFIQRDVKEIRYNEMGELTGIATVYGEFKVVILKKLIGEIGEWEIL